MAAASASALPVRRRHALLATVFALPLAACQRAPQLVKVGFVGGLSGSVAELGVQGRNGALLAVETLNQRDGPRYELLVQDDQQDAQRIVAAIDALARDGVAFAIGPMTSAMAVAALPAADRHQLPLISPTATTDELSGRKDLFFRVGTAAAIGARQLGEQLHRRGMASLAIVMDHKNRAYSAGFGVAAAERFAALGGQVGGRIGYEERSPDFGAIAEQLLATRPQAVLIVTGVGDAALLAQQLRRRQPEVQLAVSPWAANAQFLQVGARAVEGCLALQALDLDSPVPAYVDFRNRFKTRFGDLPATPAVQSYDALMVGAAALAAAGSRAALPKQLSDPAKPWPGLLGEYRFDAFGDTERPLHLAEVRDGRFVPAAAVAAAASAPAR